MPSLTAHTAAPIPAALPPVLIVAHAHTDFAALLALLAELPGGMPDWARVAPGPALAETLAAATPVLILCPCDQPDLDAAACLAEVQAARPDLPWIGYTGRGQVAEAVHYMRAGAAGYGELTDPAPLRGQIADALTRAALPPFTDERALTAHLLGVLDTLPDVVTSVTLPERRLIFASSNFARVFGYPAGRFLADPQFSTQVVHPDDLPTALTAMQQALQTGYVEMEHRIIWPDGQVRWLHRRVWVNYDDQGRPMRVNDAARDITAEKLAEEQLLVQNAILQQSHDLIALGDLERGVIYMNPAGARLLGADDPAVFYGRALPDFHPPDDAARLLNEYFPHALQQGYWRGENRILTLDGRAVEVDQAIFPIRDAQGRVIQAATIMVDITAQKRTQVALRAREEQFVQFTRHLPGRVFLKDADDRLIYCNERYAETVGQTAAAIIGKQTAEFMNPELAASFAAEDAVVRRTRQATEFTYSTTVTPTVVHWLTTKFFIPQEDGPGWVGGISIDVTREKEAELALQEAHDRLEQRVLDRTAALEHATERIQAIVDHSADGIVLLHLAQGILQTNYAFDAMLGLAPGAAVGALLGDFLTPDDGRDLRALIHEVAATHRALQVDARTLRGDGTHLDVEISLAPVNRSERAVETLVCILRDSTERNRLQRELAERYAELDGFFTVTLDLLCIADRHGHFLKVNKAWETILGYNVAQLEGSRFLDFVHPDDIPATLEAMAQLERNEPNLGFVNRYRTRDGSYRTIEWRSSPHGEVIYAAARDITAHKQLEDDLRAAYAQEVEMEVYLKALHSITVELTHLDTLDEFYRRVVELGRVHFGFERMGLLLLDAEGFAQGTYGTDPEGRMVDERQLRLHPQDLTGILQQTLDPSIRFMVDHDAPLYANLQSFSRGQNAVAALWHGRPLGWLAVDNGVQHQPISKTQLEMLALYAGTVGALLARKLAEQQARELAQQLALATRAGAIGIWAYHVADNHMEWDEEMARLFGIEDPAHRAFINEWWPELLHPEDRARVQAQLSAAITAGTAFESEYRILGRSGDTRYLKSSAVALPGEAGAIARLVGVTLDVTSIRQAELTLRTALEQEKELSDLRARFMSMASHEFRTPLSVILASTETLLMFSDRLTPDKIRGRLERIRYQVTHMNALLEDVLNLTRIQSKKLEYAPTPGDLRAMCDEIVDEFMSQPAYTERIIYQTAADPIPMQFDKRLLRLVINNLLHNALKYSASDAPVHVTLTQNAHQVVLTVRDQGIGIPPEDLKRLFEPFYRAKNVGAIAGTGLGLSIAKHAVELHHGELRVSSRVNEGSTFTVALPKVTPAAG